MEMEIEELRRQRDLAKSEVDDLRRKLQDEHVYLILYLFVYMGVLSILSCHFLFCIYMVYTLIRSSMIIVPNCIFVALFSS